MECLYWCREMLRWAKKLRVRLLHYFFSYLTLIFARPYYQTLTYREFEYPEHNQKQKTVVTQYNS